jgi:hypothetical protein
MSGRLIFVLVLVSGAAITGAVFLGIGMNEKAAGNGATRFAAALVRNDRDAAPDGAREYVTAVRAYFGAVTGARVIGTHNERADANTSTSRTYPVADLLLRTARGPAVIELAFDNGGIGSEKVTGISELDPADAPDLPARDRKRLASAFAARGGIPANDTALEQAVARTQQDTPLSAGQQGTPPPAAQRRARANGSRGWRKAQKELRCVQGARGDVAKLLECAR